MNHRSAALILTHGRPDRVLTYTALTRQGWTRPIYLIVDDEDPTLDQYRERYGEQVIVFSKADYIDSVDSGDSQPHRGTVLYARNAAWNIARELDLTHHWQLDDDYKRFEHRWVNGSTLEITYVRNLDRLYDNLVEFLETSGAASVALSQGGDHIGGAAGGLHLRIKRKAMNTFVLATDRPFPWVGRMNDDVCTYVTHGSRGHLFLTVLDVMVSQPQTQTRPGGLTGMYLDHGTYVKSFYTVMMHPSSVTVTMMRDHHRRAHHRISARHTYPHIISDRYRKADT